jgi:outer membrane protein
VLFSLNIRIHKIDVLQMRNIIKIISRLIFCNFLIFYVLNALNAQKTQTKVQLSLRNVVDLAIKKSSSAKYAQNRNVSYYWRWQNFTTKFRPQLMLESDFPIYQHTTSPVTQPDGTIKFKQISNLQNSAKISLNQSIPKLGTSIYAASSIYRIEDFNQKFTEFSGSPMEIGFHQPIFAYNWMKWYKKTEPLVYEESKRNYIESIEEISLRATRRFFRYLYVQTNFSLAESNLKNSQDNLRIAKMKKKIGNISENDFSRIELSVLNARKDLNEAKMDLKNADFELKSYIGLEQTEEISLEMPLNMVLFEIDPEKALKKALANRKEPIRSERRLIQAEQQLVRAKKNNGPKIVVEGTYGISNSDEDFTGVYQNTQQQRELELSVSIPILDWGRSASEVKLAESNKELVVYDVEQDMKDFKRSVIVQVEQFSLLKDQINTVKQADIVAENGYKIALKKFQNGEISITDLNIALAEREKAKRDYIKSLQAYWIAYYQLRILTLYDFEIDRNITYDNPLLKPIN